MIRFTIPGNPIPKARPRVVNGHAFTPRETEQAENWIKLHARKAKVQKLEGPVRFTVRFFRETAHACDLDNLAKLVSDALNGIAYEDDRQVVWLTAVKDIDRANPRTEIEIATTAEEAREMDRCAACSVEAREDEERKAYGRTT